MIKNICIAEEYTSQDGEKKTKWNTLGILIEKGDKQYVKLYHMPGVLLNVFEPRKNEQPF